MNDETIITVKGEPHYYMPHRFPDGNSAACWRCPGYVIVGNTLAEPVPAADNTWYTPLWYIRQAKANLEV